MTTANPNNRASLLAGLRTGGVRTTSLNVPHTAAPTGAFTIPRFVSQHQNSIEEEDLYQELPQHTPYSNRSVSLTAVVDGPNNRFSHQQQARGMNPNSVPFTPSYPHMMPQAQLVQQNQAMQMQMLQLEMMRIQALQAQQYQAELLAQAQIQQQQQQAQSQVRERRTSFNPPATAGPMTNSFDLRAATLSAQMRRANQADQLRSQLGVAGGSDDHVPMTAALGGRFGSRTTSLNGMPRFEEREEHPAPPPTPHSTTVISGGTSLGNLASSNTYTAGVPSKSDSASSWRRGGNNNSVLSGNRTVSSPSVRVTPPSENQRTSPLPSSPLSTSGPKFRPQPLRFSSVVSQSLPAVTIDTTDDETDRDSQSSGSSVKSASSPTTPRSASSNEMPLSPREEASKKLYEGLGIGRPVSASPSDQIQYYPTVSVASHRMVSQPTRQPRGPPSGSDELGPKNFATRIRRKAIGGLGMLMDARERREFVEAD